MYVAAEGRETAMWLLEQLVPGSGVNNLNVTFRVDGELRHDVLAETLRALLDRHDVLRTTFHGEGDQLTKRVLEPGTAELAAEVRDSSEAGLTADLAAFVGEPFPLTAGALLVRARVFRLPAAEVFCLVAHHLVFDAISTSILFGELLAAYEALAVGEPLPAELATRAPAVPEAEPAEASVRFWRARLDGYVPGGSTLWLGHHGVTEPTLIGDTVHRELSAEARDVVKRLQRELRAPEAVILLAAYYLLLHLHGGGDDLIVGSPVSVRDQRAPDAIGYHINVLPLRVRVDPVADFQTLVRAARTAFLEGMGHASVPAELLTGQVRDGGPSWRNPLFHHLFNYLPGDSGAEFTLGGRPARQLLVENGFSRFDLEFFVLPSPRRTLVRAAFCAQVFSPEEAETLLARYDELLVAIGSDVDRPVGGFAGWRPEPREAVTPVPVAAAPEAPAELVADLLVAWADLLGHDELDDSSNFFAAGGSSLLGAQLVSRIKKATGAPLKLADLFAHPTPGELAAHLAGTGVTGLAVSEAK